jgi:hypothetical protein
MSTATSSSASPAIVRSQSTSRPHSASYGPPSGDIPHRTRSTATRPPPSSHAHHRSSSRPHTYDRPPPSNSTVLASVARRDFESSSGGVRPAPSRRSASRERNQEAQSSSYRPGSTRAPHHRTPSRHGPNRDSVDMAGSRPTAPDGGSSSAQPPSGSQHAHSSTTAQPKRRTTINTTTGQWALGKTIGAGSMGKVKLAKNMETGEQVRLKCEIIYQGSTAHVLLFFFFKKNIRSRSKLFLDNRPKNIAVAATQKERIARRRSEPQEKRRL